MTAGEKPLFRETELPILKGFFVLQGTMAVWDENANRTDLRLYEGMVIPSNVPYEFEYFTVD